jgi:hypothetical protein
MAAAVAMAAGGSQAQGPDLRAAQVPGLLAPPAGGDQIGPSPEEAMAAYRAVEGWVRAMGVPRAPGGLPGARAAAVILRADGAVVGRGTAVSERGEGDGEVIVAAAREAIAEARSRLGVPRDALQEELLREQAGRLTVSLELAGAMVPLSPRSWEAATMEVAPGLEGVGVRIGERTAVMFPEMMVGTATEAGAALPALAAGLVGDPGLALKPPGEIARETGAVLYRFRTTHLAQAEAGRPPVFLHRCGRIVASRELDAAGLRAWAEELAGFVSRHGERADPAGAALCGLALAEHAAVIHDSGASAAGDWAVAAERLAMASRGAGGEPADPAAAAFAGEALRILEGAAGAHDGESAAYRARCERIIDEAFTADARAPGLAGALVLWNISRRDPSREGLGERLLQTHVEAVGGGMVSLMPWLGAADLAAWPRGELPVAPALRDLRDLIWANRLEPGALPPDQQDLAGAVAFAGDRGLPSWHGARPLAFIAAMLGDERLTADREVGGELVRLLSALRYLRQLTVSEVEARMLGPGSLGGVRASLWDQRTPPEAAAMTLLAVTRTLRSLEAIGARRRIEDGSR